MKKKVTNSRDNEIADEIQGYPKITFPVLGIIFVIILLVSTLNVSYTTTFTTQLYLLNQQKYTNYIEAEFHIPTNYIYGLDSITGRVYFDNSDNILMLSSQFLSKSNITSNMSIVTIKVPVNWIQEGDIKQSETNIDIKIKSTIFRYLVENIGF
jgi:hypothetical protein